MTASLYSPGGLPLPDLDDPPNVPADLLLLAGELDLRVENRFATTGDRDTALPAATTPIGSRAFITTTGRRYVTWLTTGGMAWFETRGQRLVVANDAARDALMVTPDGMEIVRLTDGMGQIRTSTGWVRAGGDYTIGDITGGGSGILAATPGWSDLVTITNASGGRPCAARWVGVVANGSSGADRTASFRVILDGTQISTGSSNTGFAVPVGASATNHPRIPRAGADATTPVAGTHTWTLQGQANTANSVIIESAALTVVER